MRTFSCYMWDLSLWPGMEPRPPAFGARSLSPWTSREVLTCWFFSMNVVLVRGHLCGSAEGYLGMVSLGLEVGPRAGPQGSWDQGQFRPKAGTVRRVWKLLVMCLCAEPEPDQDLGEQRLSPLIVVCVWGQCFLMLGFLRLQSGKADT